MGRKKQNKQKTVSKVKTTDDDDSTTAMTNKPVELSPGGIDKMPTKLSGTDNVEAETVLQKTFINGDKAILSTIDGEGTSIKVDPENLKPEIIGDGLIPKVLRTETVYSMSGYWPSKSMLNDLHLVLSPSIDTLLLFPKLRFKHINDIPIWSKYEELLNRTVKMMYNYLIPISQKDHSSFVSLQNKMTENLFKLVDEYDVIWKDFKPDTDFSILNGKRIMKNLSLKPEHMKDPMILVRSLHGQNYSYDDIMTPYFTENIPIKDDLHNIRVKNTFKIDAESMGYLQFLMRPSVRKTTKGEQQTSRFLGLPPDFKFGYPSNEELGNFFDTTTTTQNYVTERYNVLENNPALLTRSYYNNFDLDDGRLDRVKRLLKKYDVLFSRVNNFTTLLKNAFLANVQLAASTSNSLSNMFAQTEFGISALRRTARTAIISSLSPASVPGFINAILSLYFDNNVKLSFQLNGEFAVNWTFNAILFIFLFKPQVSSRNNVASLIMIMLNNFCKIFQVPYTNVSDSLRTISDYISAELVDAILEWWDYSQSSFDAAGDFDKLYTNRGNNIPRGNISTFFAVSRVEYGYNFWGAPALSPWRKLPSAQDDGSFATSLIRLVTIKKNQWSSVWSEFVYCVVNDISYGFVTNLSRFAYALELFASSELNMNRFRNDFRDHEIEIDNRSVLSFSMYSRVSDVPYFQSDASLFMLYFLSLDYYLSQSAMLYKCFRRIESEIMNISGLAAYNNNFFKEWDMLNIVGGYCQHPVVKDIFSSVNFNNFSTMKMTVGRSDLNKTSFMEELLSEYASDMAMDRNSRWFVHMRSLDIVVDRAEWRKFGLEDSFTVGPVEIGTSFNDLFRTKVMATTLNTYINYRQNYLKFGDFNFKMALWRLSLNQTIGYKIPTFVKYKIVKQLSGGSNSDSSIEVNSTDGSFIASTGENSAFKWMTSKKDPVTSDEFRIDSVEIEREIVIQWERDYQYDQIFYDTRTALAGSESSLFIYDTSGNDIMLLLRAESVTEDFYLDDLNDISVEFNSSFANEFTKNNLFSVRYKTYLSIV